MQKEQHFLKAVCAIAVPVALQSMLQASFSIVDQIMIGQLGSVSVAGVGYAGKFSSIYSVMVAAIGTVAGIMISQYIGQRNRQEVRRSFFLNLWFALGLASVFAGVSLAFPGSIIGLYTTDSLTVAASASYLRLIAWTFVPAAVATMLSTLFRCMEKAQLPLYASIAASLLNTGLNYLLVFGKLGLPRMGAEGAAIATVVAQLANTLIMLLLLVRHREALQKAADTQKTRFAWKQYAKMLLPILVCEFMWSIGENVYASIYGHIGTQAGAAMTLTNPVQGLMIGALCGLSQAAGVIIGKRLGKGVYDAAYAAAKRLMDRLSYERRGVRVVKLENAYQMCSSSEMSAYITKALETRKPPKLSASQLETLTIIAYYQPATKAYVEQIRGVDSSYSVGALLNKHLIEESGRLNVPGRPILYRTTPDFLRTFGLPSLGELPEIEKIQLGKRELPEEVQEETEHE